MFLQVDRIISWPGLVCVAHRLIDAAAPHLKPLLTFIICTGARLSEAIELEWRDVDLEGARVIFWRTKTGRRRVAADGQHRTR